MAIIGKIRDKGWLVLVVVGLALAAFILGDWTRITQGSEPKYGYGTVYGEKVDIDEFNKTVAKNQATADRIAAQQQQQPQPVDQDGIWKAFIEESLLKREYAALGIDVSDREFEAYLYGEDGFDVMEDLKKAFVDSTNTFNPNLLRARIEEMQNSDDPVARTSWEDSKEYYIKKRKEEKYIDILEQGMYATKLEAKDDYYANQEIKAISFVVKRYRDIPDDEIKVSDAQLKKYYEEHKSDKKYEIKLASREVHFFDIMIQPSKQDSAKFNQDMAKLKSGLATAKNDSTFVMKNSDLRFYSSGPYSTALPKTHANAQQHMTYPAYMDSVFEKSQVGQIVGPYQHDGATIVAKVLGFTSDTINARHILLSAKEGNEAEIEARADSILAVINDGNFAELVKKYSDDTGSKEKDGDLGDFFFSQMVQPFAIYVADKPIGEIGKVKSQFGIHIVQVTGRKGKKYPRLAAIQKTLVPSSATIQAKQDVAYNLLFKISEKIAKKATAREKVELFDTIAEQNNFLSRPININDNGPVLYGFTSKFAEEKILDLAFNEDAQEGDLIAAPIKDKDKHVIAILALIREKGEPSFDAIKDAMKRDYIEEQKALRFTKQMAGKALNQIKGDGISVQTAEVTFANPQITGGGFEPEVVGAIFSALKDGKTTKPIRGKAGVYVVRIDKTIKAPSAANYDKERAQLIAGMRTNLTMEAKRALEKKADVIDNRRLFEKQIRR